MEKISVIIPTIWNGNYIDDFIDRLEKINRVGEVIIIDNNPSGINVDIEKYKKVRHVKMDENIYVNPAWNLGTKIALFNIIALGQDDILFDVDFLEHIDIEIDSLVGIGIECYSSDVESDIKLNIVENRNWGYATFLMYNKDSYINIPEDLKIWCGDDFLFNNFKNKFAISGLKVETKMSMSADLPIFDDIRNRDLENYEKYK